MSFLRGSANYVWCTTSVLGKGATGAVFQGVNKHNGETVAVKTFNQLSHMRPQEVQMREFEVLEKVKHENIVKLLAIEEEQEGRGKVIVMELCTGGSLFNLLDDPENSYGLAEDEFLLVLSHLSAGMNHLRDNNLVHRDLKPGNIMKFVRDDGKIIYKLTDFGAARELQDDQQFVSLYGTEEYLHPDMYERAVLRKPVGKTFGATVDLWSIGVTLYHVATGNLPFRPFGGRRNKETMYYITTKKASGVISGVQTAENGPIQWSRELPSSCLLSQGIKKHLTPILAGLLEVNPQKMWTFEKFFAEVTNLLSKKKIFIYFMSSLAQLRVYLDRSQCLEDFQLLLTEQTDVEPGSQILLLNDNFLSRQLEANTPGTSFPETSEERPVIMFTKNNNGIKFGEGEKELATFPTLPNLVSVENDATLAKSATAVGYAHKRRIEAYTRCALIMESGVRQLVEVVAHQMEKLSDLGDKCRLATKATEARVEFFKSSHKSTRQMVTSCSESFGDTEQSLTELSTEADQVAREEGEAFLALQGQLAELGPAVQQLHKRYLVEGHLSREWSEAVREVADISTASHRAATYVSKLKESWQHLLRDRASRTLTYNDEQFHILEKIKMTETIRVVQELLTNECHPTITQKTEALADWYKMASTIYLQVEILTKDLSLYQDDISAFCLGLKHAQERYLSLVEQLGGKLGQVMGKGLQELRDQQARQVNSQGQGQAKQQDKRQQDSRHLRRAVRGILGTQDEVWGLLRENSRLIEQFTSLAAAQGPLDNTEHILQQLQLDNQRRDNCENGSGPLAPTDL